MRHLSLYMLCCVDVLIIYMQNQLGSILKKYLFLIYTLLFYKAVEKACSKISTNQDS